MYTIDPVFQMLVNPSLGFAGRGGRTQIEPTGNISLKE
jgi:hypothetical protein